MTEYSTVSRMHEDQVSGIIRARAACARSLISALGALPDAWSEADLANRWSSCLQSERDVFSIGWYQPPPRGISVLIGLEPKYDRLEFESLRDNKSFPSASTHSTPECIFYPYFSAVDRRTSMIGDHVATYYRGQHKTVRDWIRCAYVATLELSKSARAGMTFAELYEIANHRLVAIGAANVTFSQVGGAVKNIGHTVPFFGEVPPDFSNAGNIDANCAAQLANARRFINHLNTDVIPPFAAFTIEPQVIASGLPMVSFHRIVVVANSETLVIEKFRDVFDFLGMTDWIGLSDARTALS